MSFAFVCYDLSFSVQVQMQKTPSKTGKKIDEVIDRLNARWNLQIERLHGAKANREAGEGAELTRRCASRIRALCWKGTIDMDNILEDFEERAKQKYSEWVCKCNYLMHQISMVAADKLAGDKPSQERGTLLSLPQTKSSWLRSDAIIRSRISPDGRLALLQILADLLEEEHRLCLESDAYSRTSFSTVAESSRSASFTSADCRTESPSEATADLTTSSLSISANSMARISSKKTTSIENPTKKRKTAPATQTGSTLLILLFMY